VWPMIERKFSKDNELHNLLFKPSDRPKHTAVGVATLVFLGMLFIASSTDVIANFFRLPLNEVLWAMRVLVIISPFIAYPITWKICKEVQEVQGGGKRKTANVVTRTAEGEYVAVPAPKYGDDEHQELEPTPVPRYIVESDQDETTNGVRVADR